MSIKKEKSGKIDKPETNEIFIGNKPFMKYVIAALTQIKKEENECTIIKARGKFISRAVDVAEVTKKKIKEIDNLILKDKIEINTEGFKNDEGKSISVSTIAITLTK